MHDYYVTLTDEPCEGSRGRARLETSFILPPTGGSRGGDVKELGRAHDIERSKVSVVVPRVSLLKVTVVGECRSCRSMECWSLLECWSCRSVEFVAAWSVGVSERGSLDLW